MIQELLAILIFIFPSDAGLAEHMVSTYSCFKNSVFIFKVKHAQHKISFSKKKKKKYKRVYSKPQAPNLPA